MKKTLLLVALLLAVSVGVASAAGISVNWGLDCWGENPVNALTWACTANTYASSLPGAAGSNLIGITTSYMLPYAKTNVVATDIYMEGNTNANTTPVPAWWQMGDGECRGNPAVANVITLTGIYGGGGACNDYYQGGGGGGLGLYSDEGYRAHINGTWAVPDPMGELGPDLETYATTFKIKTARTVGTGSCAGCTTPMCWALNYIQVAFQGEQESLQLGTPFLGGNQLLTWNGGQGDRCAGVPARTSTWGQVKSLYR